MEKILEIEELTKCYGKKIAVNKLNLSIAKGAIYGILGPNGSGKSTTLGMVLNVVNVTSGNFKWFGGSLSNHEALKKVGAIIESPNFYPSMSALNNLKLVAKIKSIHQPNYEEKLQLVGLWDRKDDDFKTYSLGMKQRLAIASALLNDPEILILDEPTNGLDPHGIHQIREIISKIASTGTTILLASHLLDEVEKVCTHVIIIREGNMLYDGRVDEMNASFGFVELASDNLEQLKDFVTKQTYFSGFTEDIKGVLKATLSKEISISSINQDTFNNGIILHHLNFKKQSLEESFLQLTNN